MKMLSLVLLSFVFSTAHAGDICDARPDLCGGAIPKKKHAPKRNGRLEVMKAAQEVEDDIEHEFDEPKKTTRRPASAQSRYQLPTAEVTYESYLQANSSHPAIARRPANMQNNQTAFVTPTVRTTITGSTLDQAQTPTNGQAQTHNGGNFTLPAQSPLNSLGGSAQPSADGVNGSDTPTPLPDQGTPYR